MTGLRVGRGTIVLATLGGAVTTLVLASLPWATVWIPVEADDVARISEEVVGSQVMPGAVAVTLVAATAAFGLFVTKTWGRRLLACVIGLSGAVLVILAMRVGVDGPRFALPPSAVIQWQASWWLGCALAGLVIFVAGVLALIRATDWTKPSAAYQRSLYGGNTSRAAWWDAIERGQDPSSDPDAHVQADRY